MANIEFVTHIRNAQRKPNEAPTRLWYATGLKRVFDLVAAGLLLPMLAPLIAVLYLLVRLTGGPGFYGHPRVGRGGRIFRCWKLRTMESGADQQLPRILAQHPHLAVEWRRACKLTNDPRITPVGRILRKSGLDELPQIWNVLRGEMSLIGPRPVTEDELARYGQSRVVYETLRPGVTGLWQVSGRNSLSYGTRVALDVRYAEQLSFWGDVQLLLRTVSVLLARNGQ